MGTAELSSVLNFRGALRRAREILETNDSLVKKGLVSTEAEQLVLAAYRRISGAALSRIRIFTDPELGYPSNAMRQLEDWCRARAQGALLQHLIGYQVFLDHEYAVGPGVLVPRPETEALVLKAIEVLRSGTGLPGTGIEIGLGSGVISVELLCAFPGLRMLASEFSAEAESYGRKNAENVLGNEWAKRLEILRAPESSSIYGVFLGKLRSPADFMISNPPYVAYDDEIDDDVLKSEPHAALFPGPFVEPLYFYRGIAEGAMRLLKPEGWVFLEIPHERAGPIGELFTNNGWAANIFTDLTGRDRVLAARRKGI
ncbi:MAG: hypothetical protein A2X94_13140 [Bdellovibrionales bacterium GWB1_55_8]|nr:MAG: hypothetical protein A2X94_13140 [Bdellovibrionales bacterium GWB1_55_8]